MWFALEQLVERDVGLRACHTRDAQDIVEDGVHQMFVIHAVQLDHRCICSRDEVALDNLGYKFHLLRHRDTHHRILDTQIHKGTNIETEHLWVYNHSTAQDDSLILQLLDALMYRRTRDTASAGNLQVRHSRILDQKLQDFSVDSIQ